MPAQKTSFGSPAQHSGRVQTAKATHVPLELLAQLKRSKGIPLTITTSATRIDGGANSPVPIWNGSDYFELRTTETFTWSTSNTILDATSGAVLTAQTSITSGVWYWYAGITGSGTAAAVAMCPSKVAPQPVGAGEYGIGWYIHPGTAKENAWTYVGWTIISSDGDADTKAVQVAATKQNFTYTFAPQIVSAVGQSSAAASQDFSAVLPAHECKAAGYLAMAAGVTEFIISPGTCSSVAVGSKIYAEDGTAAVTLPFEMIPDTAAAFSTLQNSTTAVGIHISSVEDVV